MEGSDSEFANFTLPTLKAFLEACSHNVSDNKQNLLLVLQEAPKRFFSMNLRSSGQPKNDAKTLISTLHPLSTVNFATATVLAFVLLHNSRYNFHCYTHHEATPSQ